MIFQSCIFEKEKETHKFSDSFFIFLENVGKFGNFGVFYFHVKDIALKASEAYKNCKLCSGSSNDLQKRNCAESDAGLCFWESF